MNARWANTLCPASFNFSPDDLAYIANNFIPLESPAVVLAFGWRVLRFRRRHPLDTDLLYGTGLPPGERHPWQSVPGYVTVNFGISQEFRADELNGLTARLTSSTPSMSNMKSATAAEWASARRNSAPAAASFRAFKKKI